MTKKQTLRFIVFAGLLVLVIWGLSELFGFKDLQRTGRYKIYRRLEKNTVDAVIVGTSGTDRYWIGSKAYEEYGITLYPLSSERQPSWLMKYVLEEAKKTQDFKLAVIDMRPFTVDYGEDPERFDTASRRILDELKFFSLNRLKAVNKTVDGLKAIYPDIEHSVLSYYFPFVKFHSRWAESGYRLNENDEYYSEYLGFFVRRTVSTKGMDVFKESPSTDEKRVLHPICEAALYDLMEYLEQQDYEVLFLDTPHHQTREEREKMNTIREILDENGYKYKVYDIEDGTFNLYAEFYNDGHVNYYGAERFTNMFMQYLQENYEFPDRREDPDCAKDWDGVYDKIKNLMNTWSRFKKMERPELAAVTVDTGIQISWNVQDNAAGYEIFRNTIEGGRYEQIQDVKDNTVGSFMDMDVLDGQTYYYMIRAYRNADGTKVYSRWSPVVSTAAGIK